MLTNIKFNLIKQLPDSRDLVYVPSSIENETVEDYLPSCLLDMPPPLNQESLSSCTANASSNALRYLLKKSRVNEFSPSRLFIYYNTRKVAGTPLNQDTGACIRDVCKAIAQYSACPETLWSYDITKFAVAPPLSAYKQALTHFRPFVYRAIPLRLFEVLSCLQEGYPIILGIACYDSIWKALDTGIVSTPSKSDKWIGNHAVLICGFNKSKNVFTFQNSWGNVGINKTGLFEIPFDYIFKYGFDAWTLH
jgi:C1A family cysteine protease